MPRFLIALASTTINVNIIVSGIVIHEGNINITKDNSNIHKITIHNNKNIENAIKKVLSYIFVL